MKKLIFCLIFLTLIFTTFTSGGLFNDYLKISGDSITGNIIGTNVYCGDGVCDFKEHIRYKYYGTCPEDCALQLEELEKEIGQKVISEDEEQKSLENVELGNSLEKSDEQTIEGFEKDFNVETTYCTDSDGGDNIYERGTITHMIQGSNSYTQDTDFCISEYLGELYCTDQGWGAGILYECPTDYVCEEGACIETSTPRYDPTFTQQLQEPQIDEKGKLIMPKPRILSDKEIIELDLEDHPFFKNDKELAFLFFSKNNLTYESKPEIEPFKSKINSLWAKIVFWR